MRPGGWIVGVTNVDHVSNAINSLPTAYILNGELTSDGQNNGQIGPQVVSGSVEHSQLCLLQRKDFSTIGWGQEFTIRISKHATRNHLNFERNRLSSLCVPRNDVEITPVVSSRSVERFSSMRRELGVVRSEK